MDLPKRCSLDVLSIFSHYDNVLLIINYHLYDNLFLRQNENQGAKYSGFYTGRSRDRIGYRRVNNDHAVQYPGNIRKTPVLVTRAKNS